MPRETIRDVHGGTTFSLQIGWSAGQMVQMGVETGGKPTIRLGDAPEEYHGLWITLDRKACNDLIALIRRARDSAFGKDL